MALTIIEICNSAMTKLGAQSILSLDDDTTEARACKLRYDACRRIVLRRHPWNFAIERVITAPEAPPAVPAFEFTYQHVLPSDCLRVLEVGPEDATYRIEGRKIRTNFDALELRYIKNITDPTVMDELFSEALACYLAWDTSYKITQKTGVREELWQAYTLSLRDAKSVDAQEERDYELEANEIVDSRTSGTTPGRANR
jgi:hypothetical protein